MRTGFVALYTWYGRLMTAVAAAAGVALFLLMWLVNTNALSRKLFNLPITGTLEITEAAMPIIILLPMAYTQLRKGHIRVTMLTDNLPKALRTGLLLVTLALGCLFMAWVAWATFGYAARAYRMGESAWGVVRFPIWPSKFAVSLGAGLLCVQFLLDFVRVCLFGAHDDEDVHVTPEEEVAFHG
ncbi:TRAP transporter small permease [Alsobacter sp. SYSU M60028]|uniref:TRAP transporter small permease protein n=1 Tax=Alsobacter ponti TaxID=2962936 RepID=A0ABT1LCG1_9HYPH|nr:TRAP transporter small permease [Alsobacter ponti]MCP8938758.1 TRAP transporter small permease [Alsobacter ponti]